MRRCNTKIGLNFLRFIVMPMMFLIILIPLNTLLKIYSSLETSRLYMLSKSGFLGQYLQISYKRFYIVAPRLKKHQIASKQFSG